MKITIGTSEAEGTFHTEGLAIAEVARRTGAFEAVEILTTPTASVGNAERLEAGEIDFGFLAANWIGRAARGEAPFARPFGVRMAAPANSGPMFFVTQSDAGLETVEDLRGRRVSIGPAESGMAQHVRTILGVLGIPMDAIEVANLNFADGAAALVRGEIDAQFQCPIPNKVMTDLAEAIDIRILDYAPGALEGLIERVPFYRPARVHAGVLRGHDRDSAQVGVLNVIATHTRASDDVVGALASLMAGEHAALAALNPLYEGLDALFEPLRTAGPVGLEIDGVPLHTGAVGAYRRLGLISG